MTPPKKEVDITADEAKAIQASARIEEFLKDPVIQGALEQLHKKLYEEFRAAAQADKRLEAWARAKALDDLANELKVIVDRGGLAKASVQRRTPR